MNIEKKSMVCYKNINQLFSNVATNYILQLKYKIVILNCNIISQYYYKRHL